MNKKIFKNVIAIIAVIGMLLACTTAFAYEGKGYSIEIPSTFKSKVNDSWTKPNGTSINIQVTNNEKGDAATQATLDEVIKALKKEYSDMDVESTEITTVADKGYKCMHIKSKVRGVYMDQYSIPTKDKIFTITIGSLDKNYFSSEEAIDMIKSFKINDYKEPKSGSVAIIVAVVAVIVIGAVVAVVIIVSKKKSKE